MSGSLRFPPQVGKIQENLASDNVTRAELELVLEYAKSQNLTSDYCERNLLPVQYEGCGIYEILGCTLSKSGPEVRNDICDFLSLTLLGVPLSSLRSSNISGKLASSHQINESVVKKWGFLIDPFQSTRELYKVIIQWILTCAEVSMPAAIDADRITRAAVEIYEICLVLFRINWRTLKTIERSVIRPEPKLQSAVKKIPVIHLLNYEQFWHELAPENNLGNSCGLPLFRESITLKELLGDTSSLRESAPAMLESHLNHKKETANQNLTVEEVLRWNVDNKSLAENKIEPSVQLLKEINVNTVNDLVKLELSIPNVMQALKKNFPLKKFLEVLIPKLKSKVEYADESEESLIQLFSNIEGINAERAKVLAEIFESHGISSWKNDLNSVKASDLLQEIEELRATEANSICDEIWERLHFNEKIALQQLGNIINYTGEEDEQHMINSNVVQKKLQDINMLEARMLRCIRRKTSESEVAKYLSVLTQLDEYKSDIQEMFSHVLAIENEECDDEETELIAISSTSNLTIRRGVYDKMMEKSPTDPSQVISFVGKTHAGKSTLLSHLLVHSSFRPRVGKAGSQAGTTSNIHVYDDKLNIKVDKEKIMSSLMIRFLDVEGLDAIPQVIEGREQEAQQRLKCVSDLPRLCYCVSNVIAYVVDGHPADHRLYNDIFDFASNSIRHIPSACPPSLVIIFNKVPFNDYISDIEKSSLSYFDGYDGSTGHGRDLERVFQRVMVIHIPAKGPEVQFRLFVKQIESMKKTLYQLLIEQLELRRLNLTLYNRLCWCNILQQVVLNMDNPDFVLTALELGQMEETEHHLSTKIYGYASMLLMQRKAKPTFRNVILFAATLAGALPIISAHFDSSAPKNKYSDPHLERKKSMRIGSIYASTDESSFIADLCLEDEQGEGEELPKFRSIIRGDSFCSLDSPPTAPFSEISTSDRSKRYLDYSDALNRARYERDSAFVSMIYNKLRQLQRCNAKCADLIDCKTGKIIVCNQSRGGHAPAHRSDATITTSAHSKFPASARIFAMKHFKSEDVVCWPGNFEEDANDTVTLQEAINSFTQAKSNFEKVKNIPKLLLYESINLSSTIPLTLSSDLCNICYVNPTNVRAFPCNHLFCRKCLHNIRKLIVNGKCPLSYCNQPIPITYPFELLSRNSQFIVCPTTIRSMLDRITLDVNEGDPSDHKLNLTVLSVIGRISRPLMETIFVSLKKWDQNKVKKFLSFPLGTFFHAISSGRGAILVNPETGEEFRRSAFYWNLDKKYLVVHYNVDFVDYGEFDFLGGMLPTPLTLARYTSHLILWLDGTRTSAHTSQYCTRWKNMFESDPNDTFNPPIFDISRINHQPSELMQMMKEVNSRVQMLMPAPSSALSVAVMMEVLMYPRQSRSTELHVENRRHNRDVFAQFRSVESIRRLLGGVKELALNSVALGLGDQPLSSHDLRVLKRFAFKQAIVVIYYDCCCRTTSVNDAGNNNIDPSYISSVLDQLWYRCNSEINSTFTKLSLHLFGESLDTLYNHSENATASFDTLDFVVMNRTAEPFIIAWRKYVNFIDNSVILPSYLRNLVVLRSAVFPLLGMAENIRWAKRKLESKPNAGRDQDAIDIALWLAGGTPVQRSRVGNDDWFSHMKKSYACSLCLRGVEDGHGVDDPPFCRHPLCFRCSDAISSAEEKIEKELLGNFLQRKLDDELKKEFKQRFFSCPICSTLDPIRIRTYFSKKYQREEPVPRFVTDSLWSGLENNEFEHAYVNIDPSRLHDRSFIVVNVEKAMLDREWVAVKHFDLQTAEKRIAFRKEVALLSVLSHPRIVPVVGAYLNANEAFMITRYYPNTLFREIWTHRLLSWPIALQYLLDVAEGLKFLHHVGVIHRDVKPSNIVLEQTSEGPRALLLDMGSASVLSGDLVRKKALGEPVYLAPEIATTLKYTKACDVYSFGMTMKIVIMKVFSYSPCGMENWDTAPFPPHPVLAQILDIINRCRTPNPKARPTMHNVFDMLHYEMHRLQTNIRYSQSFESLSKDLIFDSVTSAGTFDFYENPEQVISKLNALLQLPPDPDYEAHPLRKIIEAFESLFSKRYGGNGANIIPGISCGDNAMTEIKEFVGKIVNVLKGKQKMKVPGDIVATLTDLIVARLHPTLFPFLLTTDSAENIPLDIQIKALANITLEEIEAHPKVIAIEPLLGPCIEKITLFEREKGPYKKAQHMHDALTDIANILQTHYQDDELYGADLLWPAMHYVLLRAQVPQLYTHYHICTAFVDNLTEKYMYCAATLVNVEGFILHIRQYSTKLFRQKHILPLSMVRDQLFKAVIKKDRSRLVWLLSLMQYVSSVVSTPHTKLALPTELAASEYIKEDWVCEVLEILSITVSPEDAGTYLILNRQLPLQLYHEISGSLIDFFS